MKRPRILSISLLAGLLAGCSEGGSADSSSTATADGDSGGTSTGSGDGGTGTTGSGLSNTSDTTSSGSGASGTVGGETTSTDTNTSATGAGGASTGAATNDGGGNAGSAGNAGASASSSTGQAGNASTGPWTPEFETTMLSPDFYSEGADVGDIDGDGVPDLVAGPLWYRGPDFELGGELFDAPSFTRDEYSTFFLSFVSDLNQDGHDDVIAIGDAGGGNGSGNPNAHWYENPGPDALDQLWEKHVLFNGLVSNESPAYVNLVGDELPELVFMSDGQLGYATPAGDPTSAWTFTSVSGDDFNTPYVHGLGVGDVNGDGRPDIVEATGWWEQPAAPAALWTHHPADFDQGSRGGAQMLVLDVDGDTDADIVTSLNAHGYGLSWFEQRDDGSFAHHPILPTTSGGDSFSQIHALASADLNGDGLLDVVAGKRYYAHPSTNPDPGTTEAPVLYWFELGREGGASFTPRLIHDASGVGCNFRIADVDQNGKPDIFVSNKHGIFLHTQL